MTINDSILPQQDTAFNVDSKLKQLKRGINAGFIELAKLLKQVKDEKLYLELDYETFESYIAQPELSMDRSNVYKFIKIYETFVLKLHVAPERLSDIEWTKLDVIMPHVNPDNCQDLLIDAQQLSRSDLRDRLSLPTKPNIEEFQCPVCKFIGGLEDFKKND